MSTATIPGSSEGSPAPRRFGVRRVAIGASPATDALEVEPVAADTIVLEAAEVEAAQPGVQAAEADVAQPGVQAAGAATAAQPGVQAAEAATAVKETPRGTGSVDEGTATGGPARPGRGAESGMRKRRRRWPTVALAAVAALGVAGTAVMSEAWASEHSQTAATSAVTNTSREFVVALTNFDPGTVSSDFTQIESYSCCQFSGQAKTFFGNTIRQELAQAHAASRGKVTALYVQSVSGTTATVFAVVAQTYLNTYAKSPATDTLRLSLGLSEVRGAWKVASVQVLTGPSS